MSYSSVRQSEKRSPYVVELVADTDDDISALPTHYAPGSTCFAIASSTTYMLNTDKEWIAVDISSSSSGDGSSSSGSTIDASLATEEDIDALFEDTSTDDDDEDVSAELATTEDIDALFE